MIKWENILRCCLESALVLWVTIVPWHRHATLLCALGERNLKRKTQRMFCLEKLVGLVFYKKELEKMNKLQSKTYARTCWWVWIGDGELTMQCLVGVLLLQTKTVWSSLPNRHCPQRLHRSLDASGWYALGRGRTQRYPWPRDVQVCQVGVHLLSCLLNPRVQVWKENVIEVWEGTHRLWYQNDAQGTSSDQQGLMRGVKLCVVRKSERG